jgi:hypothetical protein
VSMNTYENFKSILASLQKDEPSIRIRYKDSSWFMKLLGALLFFNKGFTTKYITTIGSTIYFPSEQMITSNPIDGCVAICHEYVHIKDSKRYGRLLFSFMYLFPQILALLAFVALPVLFISFKISLIFIGFLIFAAPLPAYWRSQLEVRGYSMTLFVANEYYKELGMNEDNRSVHLFGLANKINTEEFIGSGYYWMWPFGVKKKLYDIVEQIQNGDILESDKVFAVVNSAISSCLDSKINESI